MEMKSSEIGELAKALCAAQAELKGALKDANNPFFKSKYADLESVWSAARGPLTKNGLAVIQTTDTDERGSYVVTTLAHSSGQWIQGRLPILTAKNDSQSMGAAITYNRRFSLAAIVGIVQTDDDGETAVGRGETPVKSFVKTEPKALSEMWEDLGKSDSPVLPGGYKVKIGKKFVGLSIESIPYDELKSFVKWLEDDAQKTGKPLSGPALELCTYAHAYFKQVHKEQTLGF